MNFTNRQEYLAAVTMWKANYKELSSKIREVKAKIKEENRKKGFTYLWHDLGQLKIEATDQIAVRQASKIEAQRQYLISREIA